VSNRSLIMLADALRRRRTVLGTKWRRLPVGRQALLVVAHLCKGETYADLARGFAIGTTTVYRYLREGIDVLAAMAPTLEQAIAAAAISRLRLRERPQSCLSSSPPIRADASHQPAGAALLAPRPRPGE
jgi:hypothetical protein